MDKDDGGGADTAIKQLRVSPSDSQATPPWAGMAEAPQAERVFDRFGCVALVFYAAISVFVFARSLLSDFANSYVGQGPDPSAFMWLLVWWPHAISHRLNPFLTHDIFEPGGFNLAWATSIPLASLLASPLTTAFGPIASFNVLTLLNPALAAWTAFILCRHIARSFWPAILGGYIFGFSAYMLSQTLGGHQVLVMVSSVPLAVYLALRCFEGTFRPTTFVVLMGLTLLIQFLISVEVLVTMTVFSAMAIVLALGFSEDEDRRRIAGLVAPLTAAYALTLLLVSPYLYFMLSYALPHGQIWSTDLFSTDTLNFLIPTQVNALGQLRESPSYLSKVSGERLRAKRLHRTRSACRRCRLREAALLRTVR